MGQVFEYIKMAIKNIRSNKGRSFLTMLGIIIGISSVILIITVGNAVSSSVTNDLNSIGKGQIYIYSTDNGDYKEIEFDQTDVDFLKDNVEGIKGVTSQGGFYSDVSGPKGQFRGYSYSGNEDLQYTKAEPIIRGNYFTASDVEKGANVCVMRESGAIALFGTTDVVGNTFEMSVRNTTLELRIVGVLENNKSALLSTLGYYDQIEFDMPRTTFYRALGYGDMENNYGELLVIAEDDADPSEIATKSVSLLEAKHKVTGQGVIRLQNFSDEMSQVNGILGAVTAFIVLVAAISLLVGGIGVMNIMLVSVTERTREIGIRKALGARTNSILMQFLFESAIITLLGGIIGIILGVTGAAIICAALHFKMEISIATILIASMFSSAVGIFFGIYPAKRAAKLSPIEALRHE